MDQTLGAAPPRLHPVTHSLPSCPHVGWGHLNLTALPLDPPQPPQDLLRPCVGTNLAAALGGGGLCPVPPPFTARTCPVPCSVRVLPDPLPVPLGAWGEFLLFS